MLQIFNENGKEVLNASENVFQIIGSFTFSGSNRDDYANQTYYSNLVSNRNVVLIPRGPKWISIYRTIRTEFTPYIFTVGAVSSDFFQWNAIGLHRKSNMWTTAITSYDITVYVGVY